MNLTDVQLGAGVELLACLRRDVAGARRAEEILSAALPTCLALVDADAVELTLTGRLEEGLTASLRAGPGERVELASGNPSRTSARRPHGLSVPLRGPAGTLGRMDIHGARDPARARAVATLAADLVVLRLLAIDETRDAGSTPAAPPSETVDPLTLLGNRRLFEEQGPAVLSRRRADGQSVALLMLDLDDFKQVNDTLGHSAGDAVLREVAERVRTALRDTDLVCRVGGDEFAVLLPLTQADDVAIVAGKLLAALEPSIAVEDVDLQIDVSIGIAVAVSGGKTLESLLRQADRAMYDAKQSGTNRWRSSSEPVPVAGSPQPLTSHEIAEALESDRLVLHYQPQVSAQDGRVVGYEVLARLQHPRLGLLLPQNFLPLAERSGLGRTLDSAVLEKCLTDHGRLESLRPGLTVSVNVSPRSLLGQGLVEEIAGGMAAHDVPADRVTLEITEPASHYSRSTRHVLGSLEGLGCGVSIHEFGSGQTSLTVLSTYRVIREIKLAPQLVAAAAVTEPAQRMVDAMVSMAHALGLRVVAEGIDSPGVLEQMRRSGCDALQGRHILEPVPLAEFEAWVREGAAPSHPAPDPAR